MGLRSAASRRVLAVTLGLALPALVAPTSASAAPSASTGKKSKNNKKSKGAKQGKGEDQADKDDDSSEPEPLSELEQSGERSVVLLPIRFEDRMAEADQRELEAILSTAFEHPGVTTYQGQKVTRAQSSVCGEDLDDACMRAIGTELGATHVVELVVRSQDRDFNLEFRVIRVASQRDPNIVEFDCEVCGIAEVRDRVAAQAAQLRDRLLVDAEPGRVLVEGSPEGAKVSVDGRRVGEVPFEGELSTGEHELLISARGYYNRYVPVTVSPGSVERIVIELEPDLGEDRAWQRPTGWALVGVGSAAIVSGTALLLIDGRPYAGRCSDPANIDVNGTCRWIYQTGAGGIAILSVGIAAASVGATMLAFNRPAKPRKSKSPESAKAERARARAASLQVGFGLNHLTLSGRF